MKRKLTYLKVPCYLALMLFLNSCEKDESRSYELLPPEAEPEMDITTYATLSVNRENSSGKEGAEGSLKLVDNDVKSKYLINPYADDLTLQLAFPGGIAIGAYTLTPGNDAPARDPKNWVFEGSENGTDWTVLDEVNDYVFDASLRNEKTYRFDIENTTKYRYYRLRVTAIFGGSGLFQLSEWRVINVPEVG